MTAYLMARVSVNNPDLFAKYAEKVPEIVREHGGRFLVRGGDPLTIEGPAEQRRIVLIEFPDVDRLRAFYGSPEYRKIVGFRHDATRSEIVAVCGCRQKEEDAS